MDDADKLIQYAKKNDNILYYFINRWIKQNYHKTFFDKITLALKEQLGEIKGASSTTHYDLPLNNLLPEDLKKIISRHNLYVHIKKYAGMFEADNYQILLEQIVFPFHSPHILPIISHNQDEIVTVTVKLEFFKMLGTTNRFETVSYTKNPFSKEIYDEIQETIKKINPSYYNCDDDFEKCLTIEYDETNEQVTNYLYDRITKDLPLDQSDQTYQTIDSSMADKYDLIQFLSNKLSNTIPNFELNNLTIPQYVQKLDTLRFRLWEHIGTIIFCIIYTINQLTLINFVHGDLHLSNILIQVSNEASPNYYVICDSDGKCKSVIRIASKYTPYIYDFDRSMTKKINHNVYYPVLNVYPEFRPKFDLKFFLNYVLDEFTRNKIYPKITRACINKILHGLDNYSEYVNTPLSGNPVDNWKSIKSRSAELTNEIDSCMTSQQCIEWLTSGHEHSWLTNNEFVKLYDNLNSIDLGKGNKIYFPVNANKKHLVEQLNLNPTWKTLSDTEKKIICLPLVTEQEHVGGYYYDKYIKYKKKYLKSKISEKSKH